MKSASSSPNLNAQRSLVLLGLACLVAALLILAREWSWSSAPIRQMEWRIEDQIHLRGKLTPTDPDIVVLGIDDASLSLESAFPTDVQASRPLQLIEKGWIWPREVYAHLLDRIIKAGAKTVVLDLMFATPTPDHPEYDQALREALERHRDKVVIGADIETRLLRGSLVENLVMPTEALVPQSRPIDPRVGFLTYWPDGDNVVRRVRTEFGLTDDIADRVPSLSANALGKKTVHSERIFMPSALAIPPPTPRIPFMKFSFRTSGRATTSNPASSRARLSLSDPPPGTFRTPSPRPSGSSSACRFMRRSALP
jgi:CHASE2 domain-containing sensor protein